MKSLQTIFFLLISSLLISAQSTNSWIDFNKSYYKMKVGEDGIYRITFSQLEDSGFPITTTDGAALKLISQGEEVAIFTTTEGQWSLDDYFEFYGEKLDGKFDEQLFDPYEDQLHQYMSLFTDTAAYFLTIDVTENNLRIEEVANDLSNIPPKEEFFMEEVIHYGYSSFFNGVGQKMIRDNFLEETGAINAYQPRYEKAEGFVGNVFAAALSFISDNINLEINTPYIALNGPNATFTTKVVGQSEVDSLTSDHLLYVGLNDNQLILDVFDGYAVEDYTITDIPLNYLSSPTSTFTYAALSDTTTDRMAFSYLTIKYPRLFQFTGEVEKYLTIENNLNGNYIEFEDFSISNNSTIYDLTNSIKLSPNNAGDLHQVMLPAGNAANRNLYIHAKANFKYVEEIEPIQFTDYTNPINQGDYIIISHPKLMNDGDAVNNYVNYRSSIEGGEYEVVLANIEELYDQYSYGISKHPLAIKFFLDDAITDWQSNVGHCLLLGKSLKNSRCRNNPIAWPKNLVPTFGDTPSDQVFGSANYDPLSRIAIGRISASEPIHIQNYLDKLIVMEQDVTTNPCNYYSEEKWRHQAFSISRGNTLYQQDQLANIIGNQALITSDGSYSLDHTFYSTGESPLLSNNCYQLSNIEDCLEDVFDNGISTMNFLGHGYGTIWETNVGIPSDYNFNERYPIIYSQSGNGNIYNDNASDSFSSMSEVWTLAPESGAIAFISMDQYYDFVTLPPLFSEIFRQRHQVLPNETLGEQFRNAINNYFDITDIFSETFCSSISFSGDPAFKLKIAQQPDILFAENDVNLSIESIGDFYHNIDLEFTFSSINVQLDEPIDYLLISTNQNVVDTILNGVINIGETMSWSNTFALISPYQTNYYLILDDENIYDEICDENNSFSFQLPGNIVGIEDLSNSNNITAYPNPFNSSTTFNLAEVVANSNILISDLNGRTLLKLSTNNKTQITWNGKDAKGSYLANGIYVYQLIDETGQAISLPNKISLLR